MRIRRDVSLAGWTSLGIGGPAKYLTRVETREKLVQVLEWAKNRRIDWRVIGEGSNLLVSDRGYDGLIIINQIDFVKRVGRKLVVGAGTNLNKLVDYVNRVGLAGLECLAGIPGSVGGAVYGNAGAYGQTISDHLVEVETLSGSWSKSKCEFGYRESIFKSNGEVIVSAVFDLPSEEASKLAGRSGEIRQLREKKYPLDLKCPGSFFKNLFFDRLPEEVKRQIPPDKIRESKVAAGYLLEQVGAKGMRVGKARVADYHGNLIYNSGGVAAVDIWQLASKLQRLVKEKFGVILEPEVQLVGKF